MLRVSILVLALLVAGCGDDDPVAAWSGPSELRPRGGALEVDVFRQYAHAVDEEWEADPAALAGEFLRRPGEIVVDGERVVVSRNDLQDDSIRAERWVLELDFDGELWHLVSARWEQRCHVGRGHQDFSPDLCL